MQRQSACKHYVKVRADHLLNGRVKPLMFRTEDGPTVIIDAVEDEREAPALKAGGPGHAVSLPGGREACIPFS